MKENSCLQKQLVVIGNLIAVAGVSTLLISARPRTNYVAHEWGTFTSVQGGDGVLLDWRPLETSRLPEFVYDWRHPGLNRQAVGNLGFGKIAMLTLQRMETPVIYFYSDKEQTLDVSVQFPRGLITEWYPQAAQIGPSTVPVPPAIAKLDNYAHKVGVQPGFTFASLLSNHSLKESGVRWANIEILPGKQHPDLANALPLARSGSHYFAARDTDSAYLRVSSLVATNPSPEQEKFLFYRGVGNFGTPLRVTMISEDSVVLANTGKEPLEHLFVLQLRDRAGQFMYVDRLAPGEQRSVAVDSGASTTRVETLSRQLGERMAAALVKAGLYQREAKAMINTWTDSWFQEEGVRVLYVLPRAWTDRTLPLKLDPAPGELTRVMVGRTEVIVPRVQQTLADTLTKASEGDPLAREQALAEFRKLGRFGEPALRLATKGANPAVNQIAWTLLQAAAAKPANVTKAF